MKKFSYFIVIFIFLAANAHFILAAMESESFRINADSINIGGARESSTNYRMENTVGEIASGESASDSYRLRAGYQQMLETYISISSPADVTMAPGIGGVAGGTGNGSASWTIITDNLAGYSLSIKATSSPALQSGANSFADYTPVLSGTPDYNWSIDVADSEFGFTPEGNDIIQKYKDNGSDSCGVGSNDTADRCWYDLATSNESIANASSANHPSGTATTVKFRAESGSSNVQSEGDYTATITLTAITL